MTDSAKIEQAKEARAVTTSTFYILAIVLIATCLYSVFEFSTELASVSGGSEWDAFVVTIRNGGGAAAWSMWGAALGIVLMAVNVVNLLIGSIFGRVASGVVNQLLKIPANFLLLFLCVLLSSMIYAEYFYVPVANPLSGALFVDATSAISAFMLIFIRKF